MRLGIANDIFEHLVLGSFDLLERRQQLGLVIAFLGFELLVLFNRVRLVRSNCRFGFIGDSLGGPPP